MPARLPARPVVHLFVAASTLALSSPLLAAQRTFAFEPYALPESGSIALVVGEDAPRTGALAQLDTATDGALTRAMTAARFKGKRDTQLDLPGLGRYDRVVLVGIGKDPVTPRRLADIGGTVAQAVAKAPDARIDLLWDGNQTDAGAHLAFGAALGQYQFDQYKTKSPDDAGKDTTPRTLVLRTQAGAAAGQRWTSQWKPVADAVTFSRNLVTEPANVLWPEVFVERARKALAGLPVKIEVLDEAAMKRLGMGGILAVGQGSVRPPRLLAVRYDGGRAGDAPVAFVGKGITFDSGGISIKPNDGMWRMKSDMSGAAAVTGTVLALAARRAPVNVVAVAALAENMPSGIASRPGDVVTTMSGKTFEVMSTDAEGRMVLSDAVWYAQHHYGAKTVIDIATLTGSVGVALGNEYAGLFSRDDGLARQLQESGQASGEDLWRLPLHASYADDLKSPIADLRNGGGSRGAGAGVGAHFIGEWIKPETRWAHLDIAAMSWRESNELPTSPAGATAFGVRLFDQFSRDHLEPGTARAD